MCGVNLDRFEVIKFIEGQFSGNAIVNDKKEKRLISLVTVYGTAHEDKREAFLSELAQICSSNKNPMILGVTLTFCGSAQRKIKISLKTKLLISLTG